MGFSTIWDILTSIIMGGITLTTVLRLSDPVTKKTYNYSDELSLKQNLTTIAQVIEYDFRKMGYCANWLNFPDPSKAIACTDSSSIKFYTDVKNDGNSDSIRYYLVPTSELSGTPNPRDKLLYRVVNTNIPTEVNLVITQFYLIYFDALGDTVPLPITNPGIIRSYEISIRAEGTIWLDDDILYSKDPSIDPTSTDMLDIVAKSNVWITGNSAKNNNINITALIYVEKVGFGAQNYDMRQVSGTINLPGGITQKTRQAVGTFYNGVIKTGFSKSYRYDDKFMTASSPFSLESEDLKLFPAIKDDFT